MGDLKGGACLGSVVAWESIHSETSYEYPDVGDNAREHETKRHESARRH